MKSKKSILLLGPRQTGKSTLLQECHPDLVINLADEEVYFQHLKNPGLIKEVVGQHKKIMVDEIQRIPTMLNTIQYLIDSDKSKQFFLTGSSARKLKRGKANLLPGRILKYELGPLHAFEMKEGQFQISTALSRGLLPGVYLDESSEWKKTLQSYVALYLREEVQAEALTRDIQGFSRFFEVTMTRSGQHLDFSKYASQAMIERTTARRYFDILVDTLIVEQLDPFSESKTRRLIQHPKFYCFDVGVLNAILGGWEVTQDRKGVLFEHFIFQQIKSLQKGLDLDLKVSTYRTENNAEVDFIIETGKKIYAVEVKATKNIGQTDMNGLKSFKTFCQRPHKGLILYLGELERVVDGFEILPWKKGLQKIFDLS